MFLRISTELDSSCNESAGGVFEYVRWKDVL